MANPSSNQDEQGQTTLENLWRLITQLPDELGLRLRGRLDDLLTKNLQTAKSRIPPPIPPEEFAAKCEMNRRWLEEHGREYAGRWVALDGNRLITSASGAKEVYATLKTAGVYGSMVLRVEHPDDLSVIE